MDDKDRDRDNRAVVTRPAVVLGDATDLVPVVAISVASRVGASVGRNILFVPIRDHHYHLGAFIVKAGLHHSKVHRDRLNPANNCSDLAAISVPVSSPRRPITKFTL